MLCFVLIFRDFLAVQLLVDYTWKAAPKYFILNRVTLPSVIFWNSSGLGKISVPKSASSCVSSPSPAFCLVFVWRKKRGKQKWIVLRVLHVGALLKSFEGGILEKERLLFPRLKVSASDQYSFKWTCLGGQWRAASPLPALRWFAGLLEGGAAGPSARGSLCALPPVHDLKDAPSDCSWWDARKLANGWFDNTINKKRGWEFWLYLLQVSFSALHIYSMLSCPEQFSTQQRVCLMCETGSHVVQVGPELTAILLPLQFIQLSTDMERAWYPVSHSFPYPCAWIRNVECRA